MFEVNKNIPHEREGYFSLRLGHLDPSGLFNY